jgi:1-piperideine-2-carboxylate/1-pyrroline-2-carboxylate reductase [NAD(P)H]
LSVPLQQDGLMLSMPASAEDIAIQKLVTICPANRMKKLPTVFGFVMACDTRTGKPLFGLDGATVTGRRTAAMTVLATQVLHRTSPRSILIIGTGEQASYHVQAFTECFPATRIHVRGSTREAASAFCAQHIDVAPTLRVAAEGPADESIDLVITVTTSKTPVYCEPASASRLVAAVGAFTPDAAEIAPELVRTSTVIVDDPAGAAHEAGDILLAGIDWIGVRSLADAIHTPIPAGQSILYKSVGCAAWDLAACRLARQELQTN